MSVSLFAAGAAIILLRQASPAPAPVAAPVTVSVAPPAAPLEPQRPVTLTVRSEPAGARVEVEGAPYGETPLELPLEPNSPPVTLALTLEGYEPTSRRVSAGDAPELSVKLRPRQAAQKPPRRSLSPPLDIKLGR